MNSDGTKDREEIPLTSAETASIGRIYLHEVCGHLTRIRGKDMIALCDPFQHVSSTVCSGCKKRDDVSRFRWRDTGESISAFRRRMRDECPVLCKLWIVILAPLSAAIIGVDLVGQIRQFVELPANYWIEIPLGILIVAPAFCRFIAPRLIQALISPSFHQQK